MAENQRSAKLIKAKEYISPKSKEWTGTLTMKAPSRPSPRRHHAILQPTPDAVIDRWEVQTVFLPRLTRVAITEANNRTIEFHSSRRLILNCRVCNVGEGELVIGVVIPKWSFLVHCRRPVLSIRHGSIVDFIAQTVLGPSKKYFVKSHGYKIIADTLAQFMATVSLKMI
jgi:hypothetical protein